MIYNSDTMLRGVSRDKHGAFKLLQSIISFIRVKKT